VAEARGALTTQATDLSIFVGCMVASVTAVQNVAIQPETANEEQPLRT
jgi:hypothetical protein